MPKEPPMDLSGSAQSRPPYRRVRPLRADLRRAGRHQLLLLHGIREPAMAGAGGVRDRPGHRDRHQLHCAALVNIPVRVSRQARTVPSSRCFRPPHDA